MSDEQLLERWAVLEPERCKDSEFGWLVKGPSGDWHHSQLGNGEGVYPLFQDAVQDAIDARGPQWSWTIRRPYNRPGVYIAGVDRQLLPIGSGRSDSPATALLAAYLEAIQSDIGKAA